MSCKTTPARIRRRQRRRLCASSLQATR
jgi:hypothetical protein